MDQLPCVPMFECWPPITNIQNLPHELVATGHAHNRLDAPISSRARSCAPRPNALRGRPVTSRELPEPPSRDLTRHLECDRTQARIRPFFSACRATRPTSTYITGDRTRPLRIKSLGDPASGQSAETVPSLLSWPDAPNPEFGHYKHYIRLVFFSEKHFSNFANFSTLAQICQSQSVSPCARVLAYFHKYFQRC
jgi:hypothetical protein